MSEIIIQQAQWENDSAQLIAVRTRVFVEEQQVPATLEIDGKDPQCHHVKALNSQREVIGTGRLLPNSYIGRMCVLPAYRNLGIGGRMLSYFIDYAGQNNLKWLKLNAQISALSFYQRFGFVAESNVFIEADIEHVQMTLSLAN